MEPLIGLGILIIVARLAFWIMTSRAKGKAAREVVAKKERKAASDSLKAVQHSIKGRR